MKKSTKIIIAVLVLIALAVGGFLIWFYAIKEDAPKRLDESTLNSALNATTTTTLVVETTAASATTAPAAAGTTTATTASGSATTVAGGAPAQGIAGQWTIGTDSIVGYRVKETLAGLDTEGAGRTGSITGSMTIDGTTVTDAEFTVDMTTFRSDDSRRDGQFNGRIMEVDTFPTATFALTAPIELGAVPAEGESIVVQATGDLTLHGVTRPVTFELTAQTANDRIGVVGATDIVFAEYDIENPSNGFAETGDNGTLEIQVLFDRA